jgi:hypothetical protein
MAGLNEMDKRFLRDYQELRCNDISANGCHLTVYRQYHVWDDDAGDFYPDNDGYYLSEDTIRCFNKKVTPKEFCDDLNRQMNDFFDRNGIEGDTFLLYVSW